MFRFACSVVLWGGRGAADKCHWVVWGALAVFQPCWVCPRLQCVHFPRIHCSGSRLLYREWALSCVHFPGLSRSGSDFWVLHKGPDSVGPTFCVFLIGAAQATRSLMSTRQVQCTLSPPHPCLRFREPVRCALCLFWGADLWLRPSQRMSTCQPSRISRSLWLETGSLLAVW